MKTVAYYARTSTGRQEDEETIENQRIELNQRINDDEVFLPAECRYEDDGFTGSILERPDLDRLRADAKESKFQAIYVYDRGRLARKFVYQEIVIEELMRLGIEVISLHDINGKTHEEQLMGSVMGIFHEYERVKITERMRLGKMRKVRENKKLLGYNPKYGYDYHAIVKRHGEKIDGYFTINEEEAEVVRKIFTWVGEEGLSLRGVRRRLLEQQIPPAKKKRMAWSGGPLIRLLRDTTYIGKHYYNKTEAIIGKTNGDQYRRVEKTSRKMRPQEEWLLVEVPRIVSDELYEKVQERLVLNMKHSRRNNKKNDYLLVSLVQCTCGQSRTGDPGANGNLYYRCTDRLHRYPMPRKCYEGGVSATILDAVVWQKLEALLFNPSLIQKHAEKWLKTQERASEAANTENVVHQRQKLIAEEQRYAKAYGGGLMSEEVYDERMRDVMLRRKSLEKKADKLENVKVSHVTISAKALAEQTASLLKRLDFTDKKDIVRRAINKVEVNQKEATVWGFIPMPTDGKVGLNAKYWNRRIA